MSTCFIFIKSLAVESFPSLTLDEFGHLKSDLLYRSIADLKQLQENHRTIIVLDAQLVSIQPVPLPWLGEKKARIAIPYALEEKFAEHVEEMHFAYEKKYYSAGVYTVVALKKDLLADIIQFFSEHQLQFDYITIDWFALSEQSLVLTPHGLLIASDHFYGGLPPLLAEKYLSNLLEDQKILYFRDSLKIDYLHREYIEGDFYLWVAQQIMKKPLFNICQANFRPQENISARNRWFYAASAMFSLWLILTIAHYIWENHQLNNQLTEVETKITNIYHQFFPQAKQVISPKFRIEQLLKTQSNNLNFDFWLLMDELSRQAAGINIHVDQIRYQQKTIQVSVWAENFSLIEKLQTQLQQAQIHVRQTQAITKNGKVMSNLELTK